MAKPRWFRFSLRTLFVLVTVVACWLGWQLKWIRDRREFLKAEAAIFASHNSHFDLNDACAAPWPLNWFREYGHGSMYLFMDGQGPEQLTPQDRQKIDTAARLFPECELGLTHEGEDSEGQFHLWMKYIPAY